MKEDYSSHCHEREFLLFNPRQDEIGSGCSRPQGEAANRDAAEARRTLVVRRKSRRLPLGNIHNKADDRTDLVRDGEKPDPSGFELPRNRRDGAREEAAVACAKSGAVVRHMGGEAAGETGLMDQSARQSRFPGARGAAD